jgi:hypothetical protein
MATNNITNSNQKLSTSDSATFAGLTLTGTYTNANQPAFGAYNNTQRDDVTGDGTLYTLIFNVEDYDQASNFDGTSTFTAPVTGIYHFDISVLIRGLSSSFTGYVLSLVTTTETHEFGAGNPGAMRDANNNIIITGSLTVKMSATNTAVAKIVVSGSTKTVDIGSINQDTYFSGFLVC